MTFNPTYEKLFAQARSQRDSDEANSSYFKDPTPGQLASSSEFEPVASGLPAARALLSKAFKKTDKLAKSYVDNIPGLSTVDKEFSKDPVNEHLMNLILVGGTTALPALGLRVLNAGATNAGTLDEARKLGYYKER